MKETKAKELDADPLLAAMKILEAVILERSSVGVLEGGGLNAEAIALRAVQLYAESHPRPSHVNQEQAAEILGVSSATVSRLVRSGTLKLNKLGKIPMSQIDKALQVD